MADCRFLDPHPRSPDFAAPRGRSSSTGGGAHNNGAVYPGDAYTSSSSSSSSSSPLYNNNERNDISGRERRETSLLFFPSSSGNSPSSRRERHFFSSTLSCVCRGIGRLLFGCCCCCGMGSRLVNRLLWIPSSYFLPLDALAEDALYQEEEEERERDRERERHMNDPYNNVHQSPHPPSSSSVSRNRPVHSSSSSSSSSSSTSSSLYRGDIPPTSAARLRAAKAEKIWKSYFFGQLANVAKAAVWWSMFGVLILSLAGPNAAGTAVGMTRAAFNLALVLASPIAGAFVERRSIRGLLATTTATRLLIWSVAVPIAAWLALSTQQQQQIYSPSSSSSSSLSSWGQQQTSGGFQQQQQAFWEEQSPHTFQQRQQQQEIQKLVSDGDKRISEKDISGRNEIQLPRRKAQGGREQQQQNGGRGGGGQQQQPHLHKQRNQARQKVENTVLPEINVHTPNENAAPQEDADAAQASTAAVAKASSAPTAAVKATTAAAVKATTAAARATAAAVADKGATAAAHASSAAGKESAVDEVETVPTDARSAPSESVAAALGAEASPAAADYILALKDISAANTPVMIEEKRVPADWNIASAVDNAAADDDMSAGFAVDMSTSDDGGYILSDRDRGIDTPAAADWGGGVVEDGSSRKSGSTGTKKRSSLDSTRMKDQEEESESSPMRGPDYSSSEREKKNGESSSSSIGRGGKKKNNANKTERSNIPPTIGREWVAEKKTHETLEKRHAESPGILVEDLINEGDSTTDREGTGEENGETSISGDGFQVSLEERDAIAEDNDNNNRWIWDVEMLIQKDTKKEEEKEEKKEKEGKEMDDNNKEEEESGSSTRIDNSIGEGEEWHLNAVTRNSVPQKREVYKHKKDIIYSRRLAASVEGNNINAGSAPTVPEEAHIMPSADESLLLLLPVSHGGDADPSLLHAAISSSFPSFPLQVNDADVHASSTDHPTNTAAVHSATVAALPPNHNISSNTPDPVSLDETTANSSSISLLALPRHPIYVQQNSASSAAVLPATATITSSLADVSSSYSPTPAAVAPPATAGPVAPAALLGAAGAVAPAPPAAAGAVAPAPPAAAGAVAPADAAVPPAADAASISTRSDSFTSYSAAVDRSTSPYIGSWTSLWGFERRVFDAATAAAHAGAGAAAASARAGKTILTAAVAPAWGWVSSTYASIVDIGITQEQLLWILVALMFIDGLQVAFANAVDIDCGGLETMGLQYDLPLSEEVRTALNTRHQFVFDFSFIFFTPPVACLVCLVSRLLRYIHDIPSVTTPDKIVAVNSVFPSQHQHWVLQQQEKAGFNTAAAESLSSDAHAKIGTANLLLGMHGSNDIRNSWTSPPGAGNETSINIPGERVASVLPLLICMSLVFGGLSLLSLLFYCCGLPRKTVQQQQEQQQQQRGSGSGDQASFEEEDEEEQQKLQRQQQRYDFFGSPINHSAVGNNDRGGMTEGRGRGWGSGSSGSDDDGNASDIRSEYSSSSVQTISLFQETIARLEDLREGLAIVLREKALGWRLIFLALETALEDSMVSVVVPQIALTHFSSMYNNKSDIVAFNSDVPAANEGTEGKNTASVSFLHMLARSVGYDGNSGGDTWTGGSERSNGDSWVDWLGGSVSAANLFAVCVIAVGKIGGCLAGFYMNRHWIPPVSRSRGSGYKVLFWSVFGSSLAVLLLPLSRLLLLRHLVPEWAAVALVLVSTFLFFLFSTAPKIGFASLLQGLVSSQLVACKVFGFVGTFVTLVDAGVIAAINLLFSFFPQPDALQALVAVSTVYLLHGIVEALLGPLVILESTNTSQLLLVQRERSSSTLDDRGAELAPSFHTTIREASTLNSRPTTQGIGRVTREENNINHQSPWSMRPLSPGANCVRDCWDADAAGPPLNSFVDASGTTATPVLSRKKKQSQEQLPQEAAAIAMTGGGRKSSSNRHPFAGNATNVDMR